MPAYVGTSPAGSPKLFDEPELNKIFMSLSREKKLIIQRLPKEQRIDALNKILNNVNNNNYIPTAVEPKNNLSILELQEPTEAEVNKNEEKDENKNSSETKTIII
jgi:hypothetical protein